MGKALIFWGGWDGHTPEQTAAYLASGLQGRGWETELVNSTEPLADTERLATYDVVVPVWTMGEMQPEEMAGLSAAVKAGVGLAGIHNMSDAFRKELTYQWMVGGQFVGHPHVGDYTVTLTSETSPITADLPDSFVYNSEQYYMLVDPGVRVLADTLYRHDGHVVRHPAIWTKSWGAGRVFYSALGHATQELHDYPDVYEMSLHGIEWAARR